MTDASRRVYISMGRAVVGIGGAVALVSLLDRIAGWGFFRVSPVGTAAFLVLIGALLLWPVRQSDRAAAAPAAVVDDDDEDPRP